MYYNIMDYNRFLYQKNSILSPHNTCFNEIKNTSIKEEEIINHKVKPYYGYETNGSYKIAICSE